VDDQDLDLSLLDGVPAGVPAGATVLGTRYPEVHEFDGVPAPGAAVLAEVTELRIEGLILGGDPGSDRDVSRFSHSGRETGEAGTDKIE
jgi:hypothetical protein